MDGSATRDGGGLDELKQGVTEYHEAFYSSVETLGRSPFGPGRTALRLVLDKRALEGAVAPIRAPLQKVVHRFAELAGIDEETAKPKVEALLRQSLMLRLTRWGETDLWNAAADALVRLCLEGRTEDELLGATQRAWDSLESLPRVPFLKRRRLAAQERYRSSWARWAASQQA